LIFGNHDSPLIAVREIPECKITGEETVKTHVSRVLLKLNLRDRTQAVVYAYESGLVSPRRS